MTVSVQDTVFRYTANGVTTSFAYSCLVLAEADLVVTVDGVVATAGFTISGIGSDTGGSVVFTTAPANLASVIVRRLVTLERTTDYQQHGDWLADVVNPDFDRLWMAEQQQAEQIDRSIKLPISVTGVSSELPIPVGSQVLAWNSAGTALQNVGPVDNTLLAAQLAASSGAGLIGWIQSGVGAVLRLVQNKLRERVSVKDFGAVGDGVTDDYAAFALALASGAKTVFMPDPSSFYRLSAGIVVPDGVTLSGSSMQPANQGGTPKGTVLKFDNSVATCVTLGAANNTMASIETCVIWRAGTPPAGSTGILCDRIHNPQIKNVAVVNHARLYSFFSSGSAGIGAHMLNCHGSDCTENYFYIDGWPELRMTGGRFGRIGGGEASGNAFLYITATGAAGAGMGPNTICFDNVQFNQGTAGPAYWLHFDAVNIAQGNQVIYQFVNCHVEGITTAYIKTTATAPYLQKLGIDTCVFNSTTPNFFALDTATQINQCRISNSLIAGPMTLASIALINRLIITGSEIGGAVSLTGKALAQNNMFITASMFNSTLTLAGTWAHLLVNAAVSSTVTNNAVQFSSGSIIDIDVPGSKYKTLQIDDRANYTGTGPQLYSRTARGSSSAPTASLIGDAAAHIRAWLYDGTQFGQAGVTRFVSAGAAPSIGSTPGSFIISTTSVGSLSATDRWTVDASGNVTPVVDNAYQIGGSGARAASVWAANGTIQTSDARTKNDITNSALGLNFINALRPVSYKWIEGSKRVIRQEVNEDGSPGEIITESVPGTRTHWGLIAQEVKVACDAAGVDFGGWVLTDKDNPDSQQALRYDQFVAPLIKAVQELTARVQALEAR